MKELQAKLISVMNRAEHLNGVNAKMGSLGFFTYEYLRLIKNGQVQIKDKPENREKVIELLRCYDKVFQIKTKKIWGLS